jgi:putative NADH-flavin reductase
MSRIVVFGVTGYAGGQITAELLDRDHTVVGVARDTTRVAARERLELRPGSLYDAAFRAQTIDGADAVVVAVPAHPADGPDLETAVAGLLEAAAGARLGVVGGAASLLATEGGPLVLDTLPEEYKPESEAHSRVLDALRRASTSVDWFYLSPALGFGSWSPGEKTGRFRLGTDVLITDADGKSEISGADYAAAFVDEIEEPAHHRTRFTIGY